MIFNDLFSKYLFDVVFLTLVQAGFAIDNPDSFESVTIEYDPRLDMGGRNG